MTLHAESVRRLTITLAVLGVVLATVGRPPTTAAAAGAAAGAAKTTTCRISASDESLGPTYVTYLGVSGGPTCAAGKVEVTAYYRCRIKHGGVAGRCPGVGGFRCTEHRYAAIAVQFDARATCTRGRQRITQNYTQFT